MKIAVRRNLQDSVAGLAYRVSADLMNGSEQEGEMEINSTAVGYRRRKSIVTGMFLIALGAIFFVGQFDIGDVDNLWQYWPLLLALFGGIEILSASKIRHVTHGCFKIIFGGWLFACLNDMWGWTFARTWPVLLIALGACTVVGCLLEIASAHIYKNKE